MKSSVLILAAGEAKRFVWDTPKQHLIVDGERVIERTIRQCREKFRAPIVAVTRNTAGISNEKAVELIISPTTTTCGTVLAMRAEFGAQSTTILFSDTYYTPDAIEGILSDGPTTFFTDGQDIFAIRVHSGDYEVFEASLNLARVIGFNNGRLWEAYRRWHGLEKFPLYPSDGKPMLHFISDATQDFDEPHEYTDFLAGKSKNIMFREGRTE